MTAEDDGPGTLRIAMLAPPWIPVPAPAYGGIEEVVRLLTAGLADRGHHVTLFAPPGSESPAEVIEVLDEPHPDDIIHDHVGHTALAMADRVSAPVVHTLHGPFDEDATRFYATHGHKARIV